jgi:hypothetical protein
MSAPAATAASQAAKTVLAAIPAKPQLYGEALNAAKAEAAQALLANLAKVTTPAATKTQPYANQILAAYQQARHNFQPVGDKIYTSSGAPAAFWERKLKDVNPFAIFGAESRKRVQVYIANYANYNLLRPKGILSFAAVFGGTGWLTTVLYKQRYHRYYEYF